MLLIVLVGLCFWYVSGYFFCMHFFWVQCVSQEFCFFYQYEDDEGDKVVLATDGDLSGAVNHARSIGLKVVNLVIVVNFHVRFLVLFFCDIMFFLLFLLLGYPNVCRGFICAKLLVCQIIHNIKGYFLIRCTKAPISQMYQKRKDILYQRQGVKKGFRPGNSWRDWLNRVVFRFR